MKSYLKRGHIVIERVEPQIDCGRHRAKAVVGDAVEVTADIFRDGPAELQAVIRHRGPADNRWQESPMTPLDNDSWVGTFVPGALGRYAYTIAAWTDHFGTWRRNLIKFVEAGQNVDLELEAGARLVEARLRAARGKDTRLLAATVAQMRAKPDVVEGAEGLDPRVRAALDPAVLEVMSGRPDRSESTVYRPTLELTVDRERARFGAWYELFPRSTGKPGRHGTFKTAATHLARIADMGFDVVYLPPIHPIGETNRKGRNNALVARAGDVGVPWAIGSKHGGHTAVHPELGTLADFDRFVVEAERVGLEIALDFAIQCSPDHPWVKDHPEWFHHQPDGTIKFAENPPKKYQDIYPINFDTEDRQGLWAELKSVLEHWISHGVKIFRVDNPHTKSFPFWEWVIGDLKENHPDLIFLSEAFTKPKVMKALAKLGFTQSYTYFTWRNTKGELTEYLNELTATGMRHYFRPNFFVNTPDILHEYLQHGGPPAFKVRLVLAAFMSPSYGVYSGYELFENEPVARGSEEYLDSEKYELKWRDYEHADSLAPYIARVNDIRRKHPCTTELSNLHFHTIDNDDMIAFSKSSPEGNALLVVANLDPVTWHEATIYLDRDALGVDLARPLEMHDLITEATYVWHGSQAYVRLDPSEPAHIFEVRG